MPASTSLVSSQPRTETVQKPPVRAAPNTTFSAHCTGIFGPCSAYARLWRTFFRYFPAFFESCRGIFRLRSGCADPRAGNSRSRRKIYSSAGPKDWVGGCIARIGSCKDRPRDANLPPAATQFTRPACADPPCPVKTALRQCGTRPRGRQIPPTTKTDAHAQLRWNHVITRHPAKVPAQKPAGCSHPPRRERQRRSLGLRRGPKMLQARCCYAGPPRLNFKDRPQISAEHYSPLK